MGADDITISCVAKILMKLVPVFKQLLSIKLNNIVNILVINISKSSCS